MCERFVRMCRAEKIELTALVMLCVICLLGFAVGIADIHSQIELLSGEPLVVEGTLIGVDYGTRLRSNKRYFYIYLEGYENAYELQWRESKYGSSLKWNYGIDEDIGRDSYRNLLSREIGCPARIEYFQTAENSTQIVRLTLSYEEFIDSEDALNDLIAEQTHFLRLCTAIAGIVLIFLVFVLRCIHWQNKQNE